MSIKKVTIMIIISLIVGGSLGKIIGWRKGVNLCAQLMRDQFGVEINLEKTK